MAVHGHILRATLDGGHGPKSQGTIWDKLNPWIGPFLHIKKLYFWNTMSVFKGILANFKVQFVKMREYWRELGWHFIFILLQVGAIIGVVVEKPLVSQILKIYFTISELLCGGYWFLSGFCCSKFKQIAKIGFTLGPMA
jgi:hypothetical protein